MTASTVAPAAGRPAAANHGLARPEVADALAAIRRVDPRHAERVWAEVLSDAEAFASGAPTLRDVLDAMRLNAHPLVALCAVSLEVRLATFEALAGRGQVVAG